jgi:hypothetical protein
MKQVHAEGRIGNAFRALFFRAGLWLSNHCPAPF